MFFCNLVLILILFINSINAFEPALFTAIKASRNEQYLTFQAVIAEQNAEFNSLYGVFKCKSSGLYFFTFNVLTEPGNELKLTLRTNRIPVISAYGNGPSSMTISASTILNLIKDDLVYLFVDKGNVLESHKPNIVFSSFTGFQLSETKSQGFFSSFMGRSNHLSSNSFTNVTINNIFEADENDQIINFLKKQN